MSLTVQAVQADMGDALYYQPAWHLVVETHLPNLRVNAATTILNVDPHDGYKYQGDLYSLLQAYNVPYNYMYIVMRMNSMYSPADYRQDRLQLLIPAQQTIDELRMTYMTISAKTN